MSHVYSMGIHRQLIRTLTKGDNTKGLELWKDSRRCKKAGINLKSNAEGRRTFAGLAARTSPVQCPPTTIASLFSPPSREHSTPVSIPIFGVAFETLRCFLQPLLLKLLTASRFKDDDKNDGRPRTHKPQADYGAALLAVGALFEATTAMSMEQSDSGYL